MTERPVDVVVVGAGPGGTAAAYHLARGGARVALISRGTGTYRLGGAVSALAVDCLAGMELLPWLGQYPQCRRVVFGGPRGSLAGHDVPAGSASAYFVPAHDLSAALIGAAQAAGVDVSLGVEVTGLATEAAGVQVQTDRGVTAARLVVLAEGAEGHLASSLNLFARSPDFLAVQAEYAHDNDRVAELHYLPGTLPCLAWAYPGAPATVTVGLSAYSSAVEGGKVLLAQALDAFVSQRACGGLGAAARRTTPNLLPVRSGLESVVPFAARVLVAGEAAGVVHPLTLEGLGAAMESGRIAAQHGLYALEKGRFAATDLSAYSRALRRRYGVEHRTARTLRAALHSERVLERIIGRAQRDPGFAALMVGLFQGKQSTLGALTPANLIRYLMWWRTPGGRRRRH
ncbi:MAG: NAD(P)/FAD-dependent oxidoreductase [Anaerolineae bacterium]